MVLSDYQIWFQVSLSAKEITEKKISYKSLRQHFFLSVLARAGYQLWKKICMLWLSENRKRRRHYSNSIMRVEDFDLRCQQASRMYSWGYRAAYKIRLITLNWYFGAQILLLTKNSSTTSLFPSFSQFGEAIWEVLVNGAWVEWCVSLVHHKART